jgi:predicted glycogen debranching enzyme
MIGLPGLCLATGRHDAARAVLGAFARSVDRGMIPNRFREEGGAPEYTPVDAPLWLAVAIHRYLEATRDVEWARGALFPALAAVIEAYRSGTRHGIRVAPDGLVSHGAPGVPLTWMDARVGERAVTPRCGSAIEVQALWVNALLIGADLARLVGDARAAEWAALAGLARQSTLRAFWSEGAGYLADVVEGSQRDLALRPNQLYAIGLPHALLPRDKALRVLEAVRRELLTPVGLRTLARSDPAFRGRYAGDVASRDAAYHQGTVWPYLMGVYFDAAVRILGEEGKREAIDWIQGFAPHIEEQAGLGFVSELFDGDPPHAPGGAIAQAWSVAELLRIAERLPQRALCKALGIPREDATGPVQP